MTTAMQRRQQRPHAERHHQPPDPFDLALAAEIRAEFARRTDLDQGDVAEAVFDQSQQWLSRRLLGYVLFTPGQVKRLGDFLKVDIVDWFEAAKRRSPDPSETQVTVPSVTPYLAFSTCEADLSAPTGRLLAVR